MSLFVERSDPTRATAARWPGATRPRLVLGLRGGEAEATALLADAGLEVVATARDGPTLQRAVEESQPDVVLLHSHVPDLTPLMPGHFRRVAGAATIVLVPASLRRDGGETGLARLSGQPYPLALLADAERVGCLGVASWPPDMAELTMLVGQAITLAGASQAEEGRRPDLPHAWAAGAGRVIAVRGSKGGVGKTEVALALALALGVRGGRRVLLVDMDLAGPTVARRLGLPREADRGMDALYPALRGRAADPPLDLRPYLITYTLPSQGRAGTAGGVDVLAGPEDPGMSERLSADGDALRTLLAAARAGYDDVLLDLGNLSADVPNPAHMLLAARADRVLVVTDATPEAMEFTAAGQARLRNATGLDMARCALIVNRVTRGSALDLTQLSERCGGAPVIGLLPEDRPVVERSRSRGLPWILSSEPSALRRALEAVAEELTPGLLTRSYGGDMIDILGRASRLTRRKGARQ